MRHLRLMTTAAFATLILALPVLARDGDRGRGHGDHFRRGGRESYGSGHYRQYRAAPGSRAFVRSGPVYVTRPSYRVYSSPIYTAPLYSSPGYYSGYSSPAYSAPPPAYGYAEPQPYAQPNPNQYPQYQQDPQYQQQYQDQGPYPQDQRQYEQPPNDQYQQQDPNQDPNYDPSYQGGNYDGANAYAPYAPPPPQQEVYGTAPSVGFVWTSGYWRWGGARYVWAPGRWVRPPYQGAHWVGSSWVRGSRGFGFRAGHWRR